MIMYDFDIQRNSQIKSSIEEIRNFLYILTFYKDQQTDVADKLFYVNLIEELSMAIFGLEAQIKEEQRSFA